MADPFFGEIRIFAFNYPPQNWAYCDGSTVLVAQNQALESIIGNIYGGNITTAFQLPNIQSRVVKGAGQGPGLTNAPLATTGGEEYIGLSAAQVAPHNHIISAYRVATPKTQLLNSPDPSQVSPAHAMTIGGTYDQYVFSPSTTTVTPGLASGVIGSALGNGASPVAFHENRQPYLSMNFCICTNGEYPTRP